MEVEGSFCSKVTTIPGKPEDVLAKIHSSNQQVDNPATHSGSEFRNRRQIDFKILF